MSHTSSLTPWKVAYPLEMSCSISNFIWGNSWNLWYHKCGVVSSCTTQVHQQSLRLHIWAAVPLMLMYVPACDLLPLGSFVCPTVGQGWHRGAWCCPDCAAALQQSAVPGRWAVWAQSTLLSTASSLCLAVPVPGMTQPLCEMPTEVSSAVI